MTSKVTPPNDVGPKVLMGQAGHRVKSIEEQAADAAFVFTELKRLGSENTTLRKALRDLTDLDGCAHGRKPACVHVVAAIALLDHPSQTSAPRNISGDTEDDLGLPDLRVRGRAE